jgi:hypothetical protein
VSIKNFGIYRQIHNKKTSSSVTDPNIAKTLLSQIMSNNSYQNNFNPNPETQTQENEENNPENHESSYTPFAQMQENPLTNEQFPLFPK